MALQDVLAGIPGRAGYLAQQQFDQQQSQGQLGQLLGIVNAIEQQKQRQQQGLLQQAQLAEMKRKAAEEQAGAQRLGLLGQQVQQWQQPTQVVGTEEEAVQVPGMSQNQAMGRAAGQMVFDPLQRNQATGRDLLTRLSQQELTAETARARVAEQEQRRVMDERRYADELERRRDRDADRASYERSLISNSGSRADARSSERFPELFMVDGRPVQGLRDRQGNRYDASGRLIGGPGAQSSAQPGTRQWSQAPDAETAEQIARARYAAGERNFAVTTDPARALAGEGGGEKRAEITPMTRGSGAHRFAETVDPNTGMKSITVLDQQGNIIKKTDLGGMSPGMVSRFGTVGMKVGTELEKDIRPHSQIIDLVSRYAAARETNDNSQTNTVLAQLLNQMSRTNAIKLKGDMDRILGAGPMGASLSGRISNYMSQISTGTRSSETMQNMDRIVDAIFESSAGRIRDGMDTAAAKMRAQNLDPNTIVTHRIIGNNVVIYPGVGIVRYRSVQERDADIKKFEASRRSE